MVEEFRSEQILRGVGKSKPGHLSLRQLEHTITPTEKQLESERKLIEFMNEPPVGVNLD